MKNVWLRAMQHSAESKFSTLQSHVSWLIVMLAKYHFGELSVGELSFWRNIRWWIVYCQHVIWRIINWRRHQWKISYVTTLYTILQIWYFRHARYLYFCHEIAVQKHVFTTLRMMDKILLCHSISCHNSSSVTLIYAWRICVRSHA
jgi:hypothetical protein